MEMTLEQILFTERLNAETSKTNNEQFDKDGYYVVKNLYDPKELFCEVPKERGSFKFHANSNLVEYSPEENQVQGSVARYYYPPYRYIHSQIRMKIEKIIGKKLFDTYFYDRFYFPGQRLFPHTDRNACEISVTLHISTNLKTPWPIWIKTPDTYSDKTKKEIISTGEDRSVILEPGDGMIYKGCERPHWREAMPSNPKRKRDIIKSFFIKENQEETYYHQVFFHYVLADGIRSHCAWDKAN
jgi:hypothetical protein